MAMSLPCTGASILPHNVGSSYLTPKRSVLLYKLRVIKKDNSAIGSVYTRNGSIYYTNFILKKRSITW